MLKQLEKHPEYAVTDSGDVYRILLNGKSIEPRIRKPVYTHDGYKRIMLCCNGVKHQPRVHVLVLEAFIGNAPEGFEAAHLNGVRDDNRLENLQWVSRKENHSHKILHGTRQAGEGHAQSKLTTEDVMQIRARREKGESTHSIASDFPHIVKGTLHHIFRRSSWKHI